MTIDYQKKREKLTIWIAIRQMIGVGDPSIIDTSGVTQGMPVTITIWEVRVAILMLLLCLILTRVAIGPLMSSILGSRGAFSKIQELSFNHK